MVTTCAKCGELIEVSKARPLSLDRPPLCAKCDRPSTPITERVSFDDRAGNGQPLKERELRECS